MPDRTAAKDSAKRPCQGGGLAAYVHVLTGLLLCCLLAGCLQRETLVERGIREAVLHRGIGPELEDLDPHFASTTGDYTVLSALFEGLVGEDPATLQAVPGVASTWKMDEDGSACTFELRPEARWSDGSAITAQDFVSSYERILNPSLGARGAPALYILKGAEAYHQGLSSDFASVGVRALSPHRLRLELKAPCASLLARLSQPAWWPVHLPTLEKYQAVHQRGQAWARPGILVGNGPFVLSEWSVNHRIQVRKSATYWDAATVQLQGICFYPMSVDTEERAFRAGQLHLTEALPAGRLEAWRRDHPAQLRCDPLTGTYFLRVNTLQPTLKQPELRRALSLAVDRQSLVERVLKGGQLAAVSFTAPGLPGYTPPADLGFRPEEARRLLALAGFKNGTGLPAIELLFNSSDTHRLVAEALQEMWRRELGIDCRLANMENSSVIDARARGDYTLLRSSWIADYPDPLNFLDLWRSTDANNFTGWANPVYDRLLEQAARSRESRTSEPLLQEAERLLLEESPVIPLYHYSHAFLIHPAVRGWYPNALDHHPYKHVRLEFQRSVP